MKTLLISLALAITFCTAVMADISKTINYQGRLMEVSNHPVADDTYNVAFRLYDAQDGGNMEWEESQQVTTSNGYFNTELGNTTILTPMIFDQPLWISTQIGDGAELRPRQKLGTAAYAMTVANQSITADKLPDKVISTGKIEDHAVSNCWQFKKNETVHVNSGQTHLMINESITLTDSAQVIIMAKSFIHANNSSQIATTWTMLIDDEVVDTTSESVQSSSERGTLAMITMKQLTKGSHTIKLSAYVDQGAGDDINNTKLIAVALYR